ncbi:MAG: hypothetical protein ACKO14_11695 [Armatimonadota bacterium]
MIRTGLVAGFLGASMMLAGCGGEDAATTASPAPAPQATAGVDADNLGGGGAATPAVTAQVPGAGRVAGITPAGGGAGKPAANSWVTAATSVNVDQSLIAAGAAAMNAAAGAQGGAAAGGKPPEVKDGQVAAGFRKDPFESFIKVVVPEIPAYTLALPRRFAAPYIPPAPTETDDPLKTKGPLPPLPRRIAGVMYSGAITAILETGDPSGDVMHQVIRPGTKVPSGDPQAGELTVESITLRSLVLRADDGRSIEVKLSGLAPAVADALRGQFSQGSSGGAGVPGMGGGMPGMGGSSGMGGRGNKSGGGGPGASL